MKWRASRSSCGEIPLSENTTTDVGGGTRRNSTESQRRFETRDFVLAHSFRKPGDKGIVSGLNSANSGAPISLQLHFNSNPNASVPKSVQTFIEQENTLYIKPNGESSTVAN